MAATKYFVKNDGDSVLIAVPVANNTTTGSGPVSVVFGAFDATLTLTNNYKDVGTYTVGTRTWDGFSLKAGESQTIYLKFTVADVEVAPITITGTITNAVDGNDSAGTAISITIEKENPLSDYTVYSALLTQAGTAAPTAVGLSNTLGNTYTIARSNVGIYTITADTGTPFLAGKTAVLISLNGVTTIGRVEGVVTSTSVITVNTYNEAFALTDALLSNTLVEIRVYSTPVML